MTKQKILILKTVSYRLLGSLTTATIVFFLYHQNWRAGLGAGAIDLVVKPFIYYLHELAWFRAIKKSG